MDNKSYKTSEQRRQYQKEYYKQKMEKQIKLEQQLKQSGGDILAQKLNDNLNESVDSDEEYNLSHVQQKISGLNKIEKPTLKTITKPRIDLQDIKPKINKEQIVNFKLKKAIHWINENVNKNGEAYIEDLAEQLGYNIDTIDGLYETLKIAESYFQRTF